MKGLFGLVALLVVLAVVGLTVRQALHRQAGRQAALATQAASLGASVPTGSPHQQLDVVQQSVQDAMAREAAARASAAE